MGKCWVIASGKGGVGKSTLTSALGAGLTMLDAKVCILDADIGLRDQDAILGLQNQVVYDLLDVCEKNCTLEQALLASPDFPKLYLMPAAQFARVKDIDRKMFKKLVMQLKRRFDHVLIDCPAGIEKGLRSVLGVDCEETIIVCTPDDVCMRDAQRSVGVLDEKGMPRPQLIVNRLQPELIRGGEMYSAQTVAETLDIPLLGEVPEDVTVYRSLLIHVPLMKCDCQARKAILRISHRMMGESLMLPGYGMKKQPFFKRIFSRSTKEVKQFDR